MHHSPGRRLIRIHRLRTRVRQVRRRIRDRLAPGVVVTDDDVEKFAIRVALGNNGGSWATHYTDAHKEHWRQFIRDLVKSIEESKTK